MKITSREEARNVLECLSPTLVRSVVAIAVSDIRTSRDLAEALDMSVRNAQRVINALESIKAVKVIRYGRQKIVVSLNRYFEKEVLESIEALLPLIINSLKIPPLKVSDYYQEVTLQLVKVLGINAKPRDSLYSMVKDLLSNELRHRPIPPWLKRIVKAHRAHRIRITSDTAKQPESYSDTPSANTLTEVFMHAAITE